MRWYCTFAVALVLLSFSVAVAQYGPGGGGGYGGSPYGGGGFGPSPGGGVPRPNPYGQPGYGSPNRYGNPNQPTNPYGGSPYGRTYTQPQPSIPVYESYEYVEYKYCTKCKREVSNSAAVGQRCPHCGVYWSHDDMGRRASSSSGNVANFARVGGVVGGIVAALIGLLVCAAIASGTGSSRSMAAAKARDGRLFSTANQAPPVRFDFLDSPKPPVQPPATPENPTRG